MVTGRKSCSFHERISEIYLLTGLCKNPRFFSIPRCIPHVKRFVDRHALFFVKMKTRGILGVICAISPRGGGFGTA